MKIDFSKTDRLIELIEDSSLSLIPYYFKEAYELKNSSIPKLKTLYKELVDITQSEKSDTEKQHERIKAYARAYGKEKDLEAGKEFLKLSFDEKSVLQRLTRSYWQIQALVTIRHENNSDFSDVDGLKSFIDKHYSDEPCKEVIIDVIRKKEPKKADIEAEFWANCTDVSSINDFCNIYRERWRNHLKEVDREYYSMNTVLFDKDNDLYKYFKELRLCGLLQTSERFVECRLGHIAEQINYVCDGIVKLFQGLRASAITTQKENINANELADSPTTQPTMKVQVVTLMEILKQIGIDKSNTDLSKMIRLIAFLTGKSYDKMYNEANKGIVLKSFHQKDINEINKLLKDINSKITISINEEY